MPSTSGLNTPGTLDYNPVLSARLGPGRRPNDRPCPVNQVATCVNGGIPGTRRRFSSTRRSAKAAQGLTFSLNRRPSRNYEFRLSYTLSKAEDTSTDFQSNFVVQNNGAGAIPTTGLACRWVSIPNPSVEPPFRDQRHRFVLSGIYRLPQDIQVAGIFTAASGRPFTCWRAPTSTATATAAAFRPTGRAVNLADEATSVARNTGDDRRLRNSRSARQRRSSRSENAPRSRRF